MRLKAQVTLKQYDTLPGDPCVLPQQEETFQVNLGQRIQRRDKNFTLRQWQDPLWERGNTVTITWGSDQTLRVIESVNKMRFGDVTDAMLEEEGIAARGQAGLTQLRRMLYHMTSTWIQDCDEVWILRFRPENIPLRYNTCEESLHENHDSVDRVLSTIEAFL